MSQTNNRMNYFVAIEMAQTHCKKREMLSCKIFLGSVHWRVALFLGNTLYVVCVAVERI